VSTAIWFDPDVINRHTDRVEWKSKPLRLRMAIILAANASLLRADMWELLTERCRQQFHSETGRILAKGTTVAAKPGQESRSVPAAAQKAVNRNMRPRGSGSLLELLSC